MPQAGPTDWVDPSARVPHPPSEAERARRRPTPLWQAVLLAGLLHLWLALLLGSVPPGSAQPGQGVWGAINLRLQAAGERTGEVQAPPRPPLPATGPPGDAARERWGGAVRAERPVEAVEPGAAHIGDWAPAPTPAAEPVPSTAPAPAPALTLGSLSEVAPLASIPAVNLDVPALPTAQPVPAVPELKLAPLERALAAALPSAGAQPVAALPATAGAVEAPAAPGLPPVPALSPVPALAALPAAPAAPAAVAAGSKALPALGAMAEPTAALVSPDLAALPTPAALDAPLAQLPAQPAALPAPLARTAPLPTSGAAPAATPAPPALSTLPALADGPAPAIAASASPPGQPDAGARTGADIATAPSAPASAPRLNLQLPRARGGELSRLGSAGVLAVMPRPPELKSRLATEIEKAGPPDCRTAHARMGLLAVAPLVADALKTQGGCRW